MKTAQNMFADLPPRVRDVALILATAIIYFAAAKLGLSLAFVSEQVTVVWPPTGIALAAIVLAGRKVWPGIALGAFAANATANEPILTAAGIALGNTLEAVAAAWMLARLGFRPQLDRLRDVIALIVAAAFGSTLISATIGAITLCATGLEPWNRFSSLWAVWWIGDAIGDLVFAPLLLVWAKGIHGARNTHRLVEAAAVIAATVFTSLVVFAGEPSMGVRGYPLHYTVFPLVLWAALRFRQRGATAVTCVVSGVAIWSAANGLGPFTMQATHESLLMLQLFTGVVAATGLLLAAATAERDAAVARHARNFAALEESEKRLRVALEEGRTEIAARRQLEDALRERAQQLADADQRKDEFLAMLAHELRNPLAPLSTTLHLLAINAEGRERFLEMAERQVRHLVRLVDDLLDVSRITRGKVTLQKEPVVLADVVNRAVELTQPLVETRGHVLTVSLPPEPVRLDADPVRLAQVVANLLSNAAKYTPPGGSIWLTAETAGDELTLRVRDTGVGLAPELVPRIFDLFVQGETSLDRARGGLGIGLTLVRGLVELHGGRVEARSAGVGQGAEFVVRLPTLSAGLGAPAQGSDAQPVAARPLRVLIVEDNQDAAESLATILELWGHAVQVAFDGFAAIAAAESFEPEIILSDLGLPGMDGYELARRLRAQPAFGQVVLVALSGYGREEDKRRSLEAGFDHHFVKPLDMTSLFTLLGRVAATRPDHRPHVLQ
jgi:signal transduction histidine kinase/ActR/RegA family two-component response regulator